MMACSEVTHGMKQGDFQETKTEKHMFYRSLVYGIWFRGINVREFPKNYETEAYVLQKSCL